MTTKTTKEKVCYAPKVSVEIKKIEELIAICNKAINHSFQSESWIRSNPHEHVNSLRQTIKTIAGELIESKKWVCRYARVQDLTEELDELNQEDKDRYEPNQEFSYLQDTIDEYVSEAEKFFDYEPSDEEISDSYGYTAKEISDRAWQQKREAKG